MVRPSVLAVLCFFALGSQAQSGAAPAASSSLGSLPFLLGSWQANTGSGSSGAAAKGAYTFHYDLAEHAIERTSSADHCTGPKGFDCEHHDRLLIFAEPGSGGNNELRALYLDSEGHAIHYRVTTPDPDTAVFLSDAGSGPRFRLLYHLEAGVMTGKFQSAAPGSLEFHSYLEWAGPKE